MILHDFLPSGNGYKIRLLLTLLGKSFDLVEHDITKGETRTPEFLSRINTNGKIPALEFDNGRVLVESNAILIHLAEGTPYLPTDAWERTEVMQWLFFEQYDHEPTIAVLRSWVGVKGMPEHADILVPMKRAGAKKALDLMEKRLSGHNWLVGDALSIADISLYAYTHVAEEGDIDLSVYPGIRAWLDRVAALPGYIPITWKP
ncbi:MULTISPECIES: glutathione S-transferase family protein [Thalassospira]|jgi:glutathione S-transferase|uniref:glutathione S-transferase family protein n=1 Tax=Thalassospira TaxID=168934 RepID=UPI0008DDDAA8|nr:MULTISPECIES: glutathione S-transferase family protein [Thalassospira]MAB34653.1 glutathione S-transferase family protein [Thalassospira sp.]MDM7977548.1 glutathione S-transferase family protein [Thalassospira xiamenensis]OHZ04685.1 glutathione S-transferase [Thalassospira sp. MIT1004]HBS22157.1 glutathione S-transferase family protein [Thalassospira sp.]|tara:strand:+ start:4788 stop:5396 length:609 start_codon:yes stop_codon:yes gene_type:complete